MTMHIPGSDSIEVFAISRDSLEVVWYLIAKLVQNLYYFTLLGVIMRQKLDFWTAARMLDELVDDYK